MTEEKPSRWPRGTRPTGTLLGIAGLIIAVVFALFIIITAMNGGSFGTPVWLGVVLGAFMAIYGFYRRLRGPGRLDFPEEGGTHESNH